MPLIYSQETYTLLFLFFFLAWSLSELLGPARWQGSKSSQRRDRGSTIFLAISAAIGVLFFFLSPLLFPALNAVPPVAQIVFFSGVGVILAGLILRWAAIKTLGKSFTGSVVIEEAQKLVRHGPYKFVRHPSYTGILLVVGGFGLLMGNLLSVIAITLGMTIGILYRIHVEEAALCQHFTQAYKDYMATTKRLIPFVF